MGSGTWPRTAARPPGRLAPGRTGRTAPTYLVTGPVRYVLPPSTAPTPSLKRCHGWVVTRWRLAVAAMDFAVAATWRAVRDTELYMSGTVSSEPVARDEAIAALWRQQRSRLVRLA